MTYSHTQVGIPMIAGLVTMIVAGFVMISVGPPQVGGLSGGLILLGALVISLFVTLTVEVDGAALTCRFGPGLFRKRIALEDIVRATPVTNPWIIGWGIRWYPGCCWVWNISGLQAVELDLKNGRKFRVGTDEPAALVEAVTTAKSMAGIR